ncbi:MAG: hypothetical protein HY730_05915 [Candidatus Tectomicrobia bacterium]|uniref:Cell division protein ZapB n=1 Tax=Tectimicrobiota bacterium TaxID=2528274 RepID=A0A933GMK7_UNCTE|nr:hypothetical protein [Candidatus Tectomicrobia bacterium]
MGIEKLDILEAKLLKLIETISDLKQQNNLLQEQTNNLQTQVTLKADEINHLKKENAELKQGSTENQRLLEERELIRSKIEHMLHSLENVGTS